MTTAHKIDIIDTHTQHNTNWLVKTMGQIKWRSWVYFNVLQQMKTLKLRRNSLSMALRVISKAKAKEMWCELKWIVIAKKLYIFAEASTSSLTDYDMSEFISVAAAAAHIRTQIQQLWI